MRLLETMRAQTESGAWTIPLLRRHLARLRVSAQVFAFALDEARARDALTEALAEHPVGTGPLRVRLTLGSSGLRASADLLTGPPFRTVWLCPDPLHEAGGLLCVHKTTRRAHYETPFLAALAHGADEAILVNDDGHVVEGTRTSVWVRRRAELLTPPLAAGGLPGVARGLLLDTLVDAVEAPLTPADLRTAPALYVSNALRGLARVRLVEESGGGGME